MKLTDAQIRRLKPEAKKRKYFDGDGLYLEVSPQGGRSWRVKYRFQGKEKLLTIGSYPEISLSEARGKCLEARRSLQNGIDPCAVKRAARLATKVAENNRFEKVAQTWLSKRKALSEGHIRTVELRLQNYIIPALGQLPLDEVSTVAVRELLEGLERRGVLETAKRVRVIVSQIFRYAIASGLAQNDPTQNLHGMLTPTKPKSMPAITDDPQLLGRVLRLMDAYKGTPTVCAALKLQPILFCRPGEMRHMKWSEIDFLSSQWSFVLSKTHQPHIVPLSRQAVKILRELQPFTAHSEYVFPGLRSRLRPMSENAVLGAMKALEITSEMTVGHGFRASARTILDEVLGFRPDIIEQQLGHTVKDPLGRAYNRTKHLEARREMMQRWADYLDELKGQI
jgi:integrase